MYDPLQLNKTPNWLKHIVDNQPEEIYLKIHLKSDKMPFPHENSIARILDYWIYHSNAIQTEFCYASIFKIKYELQFKRKLYKLTDRIISHFSDWYEKFKANTWVVYFWQVFYIIHVIFTTVNDIRTVPISNNRLYCEFGF